MNLSGWKRKETSVRTTILWRLRRRVKLVMKVHLERMRELYDDDPMKAEAYVARLSA